VESLRASAIDYVVAGDAASEGAHAVRATNSLAGTISGRTWRQAQNPGAFGYRLDIREASSESALELSCVFGARDRNRAFSILVDGTTLATPELDGEAPGVVRMETWALPAELRRGRDAITITFQAADRWAATTANVFGCGVSRVR
jgi:hypothetical protein